MLSQFQQPSEHQHVPWNLSQQQAPVQQPNRPPSQPARFQSRAAPNLGRPTSAPPTQFDYNPGLSHPHRPSIGHATMTAGGLFVAPHPNDPRTYGASIATFSSVPVGPSGAAAPAPAAVGPPMLRPLAQSEGTPFRMALTIAPSPYYTKTHHEFQPFDVPVPGKCTILEQDDPSAAPDAEEPRWSTMDCRGNALKRLNPSLGALFPFLTVLLLSDNMLATLPDAMDRLYNLETLDLSTNRLRAVPDCVTRIVSLRSLKLQNNRIRELPLLMGRLFRLKKMLLDRERISVPPQKIVHSGARAIVTWLRDRMPLAAPRPPARPYIDLPLGPSALASVAASSSSSSSLAASTAAPSSSSSAASSSSSSSSAEVTATRSQPQDSGNSGKTGHTRKRATRNDVAPFKIMCYNILAESYATSTRHSYCPAWALKWSYRREVILKLLLESKADIICLQEVESGQFESFFRARMEKYGYIGIFLPKSRARNMDDWARVDGCAMFYRSTRFKLIEEHKVEYQSVAIAKHKAFAADQSALQRLLGRDNIAIVLVLRAILRNGDVDTGPPLVVANTHIHWNPAMSDVKLMQVAFLLEKVQSLVHTNASLKNAAVLICGDFNLTPNSGGFELLSRGSVVPFHADFSPPDSGDTERDKAHAARAELNDEDVEAVVAGALEVIKAQDAEASATASSGSSGDVESLAGGVGLTATGPKNAKFAYGSYTKQGIAHSLNLASVYAPLRHPFTNYTDEFVGCLDYIFHNQQLVARGLLAPVHEEHVRLTCLPSPFAGSDHLPIGAQFSFAE